MKIRLFLLGILAFQLAVAELAISSQALSSEESAESKECEENEFYSEHISRCLGCTSCGTNMYVKRECSTNRDTVCDWCLSENPTLNHDFFRECNDYRKLIDRFRNLWKDDLNEMRGEVDEKYISNWPWMFYVLLAGGSTLALIVSFWTCCTRRNYTRVINVAPPELSESDNHNIIFAAKHIQEKLSNKRGNVKYEYV